MYWRIKNMFNKKLKEKVYQNIEPRLGGQETYTKQLEVRILELETKFEKMREKFNKPYFKNIVKNVLDNPPTPINKGEKE